MGSDALTFREGLAHWQAALLALSGLTITATIARHFATGYVLRRTTFLTPDSPGWRGTPGQRKARPPKVSILVPAKDEAANIAACVESLLAQDYPNLEVIVIDDRSADDTDAIVTRIALRDARLRLLRIDALPSGWTGKTHALYRGRAAATGEWLLFVDADATLHPHCLSAVLRDAVDHAADLESVLPRMDAQTFWERAFQPYAATMLLALFPLTRANDRRTTAGGFANGQFLLFRTTAYDAIGGHQGVQDRFLEDVALGRRIKETGHVLRVACGPAVLDVRMYATLGQIVRGWSRIFYGSVEARRLPLVGLCVMILLMGLLPTFLLGLAAGLALAGSGGFAALLAGLAVTQEALQTVVFRRAYAAGGASARSLLWRHAAMGLMLVVLARSLRLCRTHQVVWRGTDYAGALQQTKTAAPLRRAA